jgi:hypothetical protein
MHLRSSQDEALPPNENRPARTSRCHSVPGFLDTGVVRFFPV